jgi:putative transposase
MLLTERILIKPNHSHYNNVRKLCRETASVSNQALYYFRQSFFNHETIKWAAIDKLLKLKHSDKYNVIPNAISQSVIKKIGTDFKAFWQAYKQWQKQPSKFKAKPKIPNYRALKTAIQPAQGISIRDGYLIFPSKLSLNPMKIRCASKQSVLAKSENAIVKEIRYVPHGSCFWLEIVYDENKILHQDIINKRKIKLNEKNVLSIDIGVNNLATLVSNKPDFKPVLISGKPVKSLNQRYNKKKAELQSLAHRKMIGHQSVGRFCAINDYFHKVSHYIVELCIQSDIGHIVIGKNSDWKQNVNIGKVNNQKFVSIPFASLISKITYKAEQYGIKVTMQEESYTSKADSLALDTLPTYQKGHSTKHTFSGKRIKRGLYQSVTGKLLNADVNGAINILRKVIGDGFVKNLSNRGAVFAPMRWTPAH